MLVKTKIQQLVQVWQEQELIIEVNSIEEFEALKSKNELEDVAIDWGDVEMLWDSVKVIEEDDHFSEILEIIEE